MDQPRVGFLGLGAMGSLMARRVRAAGYPLTVWNRSAKATEPFAADGVAVAASPAEVAAKSDVVLSMLFDDDVVRDVVGQAISAGRAGLTLVEMSTVAPATARAMHAAAAAKEIDYLDAPVSGSTPQAEQGQLVVLVGGDGAVLDRVRPVLMAMGKSVEHLGGPGVGATAKLAINSILVTAVQALAEGLALAERGGVDRKQFLDVIGQTAVVSPGQKAKFAMAERDQFPPAFALRTAAKDMRLVSQLAADLGLPVPAAAATRAAADRAEKAYGKDDFSVLIRAARENH